MNKEAFELEDNFRAIKIVFNDLRDSGHHLSEQTVKALLQQLLPREASNDITRHAERKGLTEAWKDVLAEHSKCPSPQAARDELNAISGSCELPFDEVKNKIKRLAQAAHPCQHGLVVSEATGAMRKYLSLFLPQPEVLQLFHKEIGGAQDDWANLCSCAKLMPKHIKKA